MPLYGESISRLLGENKKVLAINVMLIANAFIGYSYSFNYLLTTINSAKLELLPIIEVHFVGHF